LGRKIMSRHATDAALTPRPINFRPPRHSAKFVGAYAGGYHSFLVHESGAVYSFGLNNYGQLGLGHTETVDGPELIEGLEESRTHFTCIQGGEHHSIALDSQGKVWVWGRGDSGQLGIEGLQSSAEPLSKPTPLSTLPGRATQISAGGAFSLAVVSSSEGNTVNSLYGWGYGEMGQLANESEDAPVPHRFALKDRRVFEASAGGQHTVLLLSPKD
jgi:regulator of chromosome condensation